MLRRIQKRKDRRNKLLMGAVLVFLMVFSLLGIIVGNQGSGDSYEYNDFKFKRTNQYYTLKIDGEELAFNFLPPEVLNLKTEGDVEKSIKSPMMYLTFDPNSDEQELVYLDVVRNDLSKNIDASMVHAITNSSNMYLLPLVTCDNATPYVSVIYFNVSEESSIIENDNCLILNGQKADFFKIRDYLLYTYLGIFDGAEEIQEESN